jgi:zinc protease
MTMSLRTPHLPRRLLLNLVGLGAFLMLPGPAHAIEIQRIVSPGGIEAWLVETHSLPIISIEFAFAGGTAQDPPGLPGVANFVSVTIDEGAGDLDSQAFQGLLQEYAISLYYSAYSDNFFGTLRTLTDNADLAFDLLRLSLTEPRFDAEPVERMRSDILAGINAAQSDPYSIAGEIILEAILPDHPYGWPASGTMESVAAITTDDLRAYRAKVFARSGLSIAVVGDIDAATLGARLDETFGTLPAEADLTPVPDVEPVEGVRIDVPMDIPQTSIQFATAGIAWDDPDIYAAIVANYILGGPGFSSRLFNELRERRGLVYSVGTDWLGLEHSQALFGSTQTRPDGSDEALALIEEELRRFVAEGPTEAEVERAKAFLIGSYPLGFTTSGEIASQLLGLQLDDLGIDYVNRRNDRMAEVTVDDVKAVLQRILGGHELTVVRVGPVAPSP